MAALYTFLSLRTVIRGEARLGLESQWDDVLKGLLTEVFIERIIADKPREFLKLNAVIAPAVGEIGLPVDFLLMDRVQYTAAGLTWELSEEDGPVCPARVQGKPASFEICMDLAGGVIPTMILYPAYVAGIDSILIDYYSRPAFSADGDQIPYDRAIPAVKKEVLQRLQIMQNKPADELAKMLMAYEMASRKVLQ